jgi:hypothetical protein
VQSLSGSQVSSYIDITLASCYISSYTFITGMRCLLPAGIHDFLTCHQKLTWKQDAMNAFELSDYEITGGPDATKLAKSLMRSSDRTMNMLQFTFSTSAGELAFFLTANVQAIERESGQDFYLVLSSPVSYRGTVMHRGEPITSSDRLWISYRTGDRPGGRFLDILSSSRDLRVRAGRVFKGAKDMGAIPPTVPMG